MSEHTPTPWEVRGGLVVTGPRGGLVARCDSDAVPPTTARRNAAFIVRAANSHDALVAALRAVEWRGGFESCPSCAIVRPEDSHHLPDCPLDKALRAAEPD